MYPQTHVFFAEAVLKKQGDLVTLGSILPDMLINKDFSHCRAHNSGAEIYRFAGNDSFVLDFGKAVCTHGFDPKGLDYYGDEKYMDYERGYCFERARPFVARTVEACNISQEIGWWKAHNIIEMGVETIISSTGYYDEKIKDMFQNTALLHQVDELLRELWGKDSPHFVRRLELFAKVIQMEKATPESLAKKYDIQMQLRHKVKIDVKEVARLINDAADSVFMEVKDFFAVTSDLVKKNIQTLADEEAMVKF